MQAYGIQLAVLVIEEAIKNAPEFLIDLKNIFGSGVPSPEDFAALREKIASESYAKFVPDSALPK
jgi:hypothetical protein